MNLGTAQIIQGNALNLPLSDNSVDLICTSPPYFGLRSYQDGGMHYEGQIGSEATPAEFLDALLAATREMVRVLKPSGSIFVNLGDKYSSGSSGDRNTGFNIRYGNAPGRLKQERSQVKSDRIPSMPTKSLIGIPWRYAIRCIDQLQLILRAEIIWAKPNGLPESVTDRVRRSHEQWFHMVKQPRYFSAVDEIREEHTGNAHARGANARVQDWTSGNGVTHRTAHGNPEDFNPLGKLPGSVWTIPTQPLTPPPKLDVQHFAAYPMEWPRRIIQGWTPNGICTACGEGRRPVSQSVRTVGIGDKHRGNSRADKWIGKGNGTVPPGDWGAGGSTVRAIKGYVCACTPFHWESPDPDMEPIKVYDWHLWDAPPTTPATVVDVFGGTGTTALVAKALGRTGITVDLSADYCRLAEWRCNDPRELAAALQVEKPEPVHPDQLDLFSDGGIT